MKSNAKKTNIVEMLREIMSEQNITNAALGKRIDVSGSAVFERLDKDNISVSTLCQMLKALDCELMIVTPSSKKVIK